MIRKGSLYHASDKAVFDALCQHKMNKSNLKDLLLSRGILSSKETEKEEVAAYFSRLSHDFFDHQRISSILASHSQRERTSSLRANGKLDKDTLEKVAKGIQKKQRELGNKAEYTVKGDSVEIKVDYEYLDHRKSEFQQLVKRDAVIVLENDDQGVNLRWPSNDYVEKNIKDNCINSLSSYYDDEPEIDKISLMHLESAKERTLFFRNLIKAIENHDLGDVTDVYVFHPKKQKDDDGGHGIHISRASLKGEGVLLSPEFKNLEDRGFYISKIAWTVKKNNYDSDLYAFEAQFRDPEKCDNFAYLVKGFQKYIATAEYSTTVQKMDRFTEIKYSRLLEKAARESIDKLTETNKGDGDE